MKKITVFNDTLNFILSTTAGALNISTPRVTLTLSNLQAATANLLKFHGNLLKKLSKEIHITLNYFL
jgi:hypothetical protein